MHDSGEGGQDAPDETPDLEDFEQDKEDPDKLDQAEPTQEIDELYTSNDGAFKKSHMVQQRYLKLFNLSADAVTMFRDRGTYDDLEQRLRNVKAWEQLVEGGGRYQRLQDQVYTNENLRFLDEQLEELKQVPAQEAGGKGREEQKIDPGLIQQQADRFLGEFGSLLDEIPNPDAGTSVSGDTPQFVEELDTLFGGMIQHLLSEAVAGNPFARTLFKQYESLVEGYEAAYRKLDDYKKKSPFALADKQEKRRRGIVKQLFSYDREGKYKSAGKPDYNKLVAGLFTLFGKFEGASNYDPDRPLQKKGQPKPPPAISEARKVFSEHAGPRGGLTVGQFLQERFSFIFREVAYSGAEYVTNPVQHRKLERVFQKYNTPNAGGPPLKLGDENTVYNWVTQLVQERDAGNARGIRGTPRQFEVMFARMNQFQNEWRQAARGVDWARIHKEHPSPHKKGRPDPNDLGDEKSPPSPSGEQDPPFEQTDEARASVAQKMKSSSDFQNDLVKFMWQENTAKVLAQDDPDATDLLLAEFYALWKNYFPSFAVTPADWPKFSVQRLRENIKNRTGPDILDVLFSRGASRPVIAAQKSLANDDPAKVYVGQKTRRSAFLKFIGLVQDRKRYLEWAGVVKGKQLAPKQEPGGLQRTNDLADHMRDHVDQWLQDGLSDRNQFGPVGQQMNKARVAQAIALGDRLQQENQPHFKIVAEISKFLGFRTPRKHQALLAKMLSDTGVGDGAPPRPWTWQQLDLWFGETATYWAERLEDEFDVRVAKRVAEQIGNTITAGRFPKNKEEGTFLRSFRSNPAELELFELGRVAHKHKRQREIEDKGLQAQRAADAERVRLRKEHEQKTDDRRVEQERNRRIGNYQRDLAIYQRKLFDPQNARELGRKDIYQQEVANLTRAIEELRGSRPATKAAPATADIAKLSTPSGPGRAPPPPARPRRPATQQPTSHRVSGVNRVAAGALRQQQPHGRAPARPRVRIHPAQPPPRPVPRGVGQAVQDAADRNAALILLRQHPRFKPEFEKNFEYDPQTRTYKEKRLTTYSYHPIVQQHLGSYQLQAVQHQEIARVLPRHPDLETYKRSDVNDRVRKFNQEAYKRPIDGRARQYLNVGPWIRLRLLKTSVHITRKGSPPQRAYSILAKHMLKQIEVAEKPRILAPSIKRTKQQMLTIATTETLRAVNQSRLAAILEKGLRRRAKHIIYRQTNSGGPLLEHAKTNESLY